MTRATLTAKQAGLQPGATTAPPLRDLADFFATLADPSRLAMLALLQRHGELCVCDIQEVLGVTQSRASRHLQALRSVGLVQDRRVGIWVYYRAADRPGPRQGLLLKLLPKLVDESAVTDIDRKLATWRRQRDEDPCAAERKLSRRGSRR